MDKFFRMFSLGKKEETKNKEEEDLTINQQKVTYEVRPLLKDQILETSVREIKIGGQQVDSYENYIKKLDDLFSQYNSEKNELEYRYTKAIDKNSSQILGIMKFTLATNNLDKMKIVGKIGDSPTILDETSLYGSLKYSYSKY